MLVLTFSEEKKARAYATASLKAELDQAYNDAFRREAKFLIQEQAKRDAHKQYEVN